jgi:hypothetical protein
MSKKNITGVASERMKSFLNLIQWNRFEDGEIGKDNY